MGDSELPKAAISKLMMESNNLAILIDPPFGARIEPLANTIQILNRWYKSVDGNSENNIQGNLIDGY